MIALLAASPAKSDPVWLIQGSSTITGTNACSPAPCTESFTFSLLFQWTNKQSGFPDVYTASYIPGSLESSFWGVAGSFAPTNNGITFCCVPGQYLPFYGDHGEIDLAFPISVDSPSITPTIVGSHFTRVARTSVPRIFLKLARTTFFQCNIPSSLYRNPVH
jgi:hypothetical protein